MDTYRPAVARYALEAGADIINDVSGAFSASLAAIIRQYGAGWVLMHAGPENAKTEDITDYPLGIINHVRLFFDEMHEKALGVGIPEEKLCFDPGFGFAKTNEQNMEASASAGTTSLASSSFSVKVIAPSATPYFGKDFS